MTLDGLQVRDAKRPLTLIVTRRDIKYGRPNQPSACAGALACKRIAHAEEARVYLSRIYLKVGKGANKHWERLITPKGFRTEQIVGDRGGKMMPDVFIARPATSSQRLGYSKPTGPKAKAGKRRMRYHVVGGVRPHGPMGAPGSERHKRRRSRR